MPRNSVTATLWRNLSGPTDIGGAWGTHGTQSMVPVPHIEGLGSWAAKMDDRLCFLAFQQADNIFSEGANKGYSVGDGAFAMIEQYRVYYNGYHPQMVFGFSHYSWHGGLGVSGTYSVRLGGVDFGTVKVSTPGGTTCEWYVDIPDSFAAGEYTLQFYAANGNDEHAFIDVYDTWAAWLPVRLF